MTLELRVLTGSRAGTTTQFDKTVVAIGRHGMSDLRFDPQTELDVSTRHAEIRQVAGVWTLYDEGSTNGTYVNGIRVPNDRTLSDGDVISFGANGPKVEVRGVGGTRTPPPTAMRPSAAPSPSGPGRVDTTVRVAHAVREQTQSMKRVFIGVVAALLALGILGFVFWQKQTTQLNETVKTLIARAESSEAASAKNIAAARALDPAFAAKLEEYEASKHAELARAKGLIAGGTASKSEIQQISKSLRGQPADQPSLSEMNLSRVYTMNEGAVAFMVADLDSVPTAGTAFSITPSGLMVTNKHVVRAESGRPASRLAVKFANTSIWISAHLVRISDTDDLALIQLDSVGKFPVVGGVSRTGALAQVGAPIAQIGYPHANDAPMQGKGGLNFTASTTMAGGHVSKRLDDVLQIDSYAGHGASGSPVFNTLGHVVGVVYGGVRESNGRIVLAVPSQRLAAFLGSDAAAILR